MNHTQALAYLEGHSPKQYRKIARTHAVQLTEDYEVETLEGWLHAKKGDYLVVNEDGGWPWPVKKEIFEKTYVLLGNSR